MAVEKPLYILQGIIPAKLIITLSVILLYASCALQPDEQKSPKNSGRISDLLADLSRKSATFFDTSVVFYDNMVKMKIDSLKLEYEKLTFVNDSSRLAFITRTVFEKWRIEFSDDRNAVKNISPCSVLGNKKGSCVGISLVILLIGETLQLPLYGVAVPGHFFVRYQSKAFKINIETMKNGASFPDSWYVDKFIHNTKNSIVETLSAPQIIAVIHYNMGNILLKKGSLASAIKNYIYALNFMPELVEARGNLAIALERSGDSDAALKEMLKLEKSGSKKVFKNIAILYLKKNNFRKANNFFQKALKETEMDPELLYFSAVTEYNLGNYEKTQFYYKKLLQIAPEFKDELGLGEKLKKR
jgi:tetratricopeptide (TPR) repeat protein